MPKVKTHKSKAVHPRSRKAFQIAREEYRSKRLMKTKEELKNKMHGKLNKLKWFRSNIDTSKTLYTTEEVSELVEQYLKRFSEEEKKAEELQSIKGRHNNDRISHEYKLKFIAEQEKGCYETCGLEIPNLRTAESFKYFSTWEGEARYLPAIQMTTVKKTS